MGERGLVLSWCGFREVGCQQCLAGERCGRERGHMHLSADAPTASFRGEDGRQSASERGRENLSVFRIGQIHTKQCIELILPTGKGLRKAALTQTRKVKRTVLTATIRILTAWLTLLFTRGRLLLALNRRYCRITFSIS